MAGEKANLDNIRIVLVEPQVPGNVGAAARAIKNMGLTRLVLVNPWFHNHPQARYMAHGSVDILDNALVVDELSKAVSDSVLVVGTTQRKRHNVPFLKPDEAADRILGSSHIGPVSILFGREDKGLSNKELSSCQLLVTIPSSSAQPSLNLSQAVMVIVYEIYSATLQGAAPILDLAPSADLKCMYIHLKESLTALGMKEWNDGDNYMKSLRRVFSRTQMERRDVTAIHKLCGEIDKYAIRVRAEMNESVLLSNTTPVIRSDITKDEKDERGAD